MNIQIGKVPPPSDGSTAARAAPSPGSNTGAAPAAHPAPATAPAAPVATHAASTAQAASVEATRQIARQINDFLDSSSAAVQFSVDQESERVVVRIVDTQTQQVIRQIPSEEMLAISKSLDQMTGLLIKQKA